MRKRLLPAFVFFALVFVFSTAHAQDINLSHTLTGVTEGIETATLDVTLHVENSSLTDHTNLVLGYVPYFIIAVDPVSVNLATIGAYEAIDVPITIVTPLPFNEAVFEYAPLFWAGEHDNPDGTAALIEFPAESRHLGGAL